MRTVSVHLTALLALALVAGSAPVGAQGSPFDEGDEGDERCIQPPHLEATYQWSYNMSNGRTRIVEVAHKGPGATPQGRENITRYEFTERKDGERQAWGKLVRYGENSTYPWALASKDRWAKAEDRTVRRMDTFDPPFTIVHERDETCPGEFWRFETRHFIAYGKYGQAKQENATEGWQVRAGGWTNLTVPAGTLEVLPVTAVRESDRYEITTYWSPEARAPAKVEQGPGGANQMTRELADYVLDRRPQPRFEVTPLHPQVGDTITLNATASFDYEGPIQAYRWLVNGEVHRGRVVQLNPTEETTLDIHLVVTDAGNRSATLGTSKYVAPDEGSGLGVSGPGTALQGQVVTLRAHTSFDPVEVRWRVGSEVVGQGETYQFYMEETRNLTVDAFDKSGYVYTANHTVELARSASSNGSGPEQGDRYPGSDGDLAILEPLEGQVVPAHLDVRVRTQDHATLFVDGRPVWQGSADPSRSVSVDLDPGRHELLLQDRDGNHSVNVTVAGSPSPDGPGGVDTDARDANATGDAAPVPAPAAPGAALAALAAAWLRRRPD